MVDPLDQSINLSYVRVAPALPPEMIMRDDVPNSEAETYEHIPWNKLTLVNSPSGGRWMYVVAGLLITASIAAVVARMIWQPDVAIAIAPSSVATPVLTVPQTTTAPSIYSEADLMAVSPPVDLDRRVAVAAEQYVRHWAGGAVEPWTYVEWTAVDSIEDLGVGLFRVGLSIQLLAGTEGGTVRLPVEGVDVMVRVEDGVPAIADLPAPRAIEELEVEYPTVESNEVPEVISMKALEEAELWGVGTIVSGGVVGGRWRVEVSVESPHGQVRSVAVWLTPDGVLTHPPG